MTSSKNKFRLEYADNPDLKSALGGLSSGDDCSIELKLQVVSNDDTGLEGNIEEITYDTPGDSKDGGSDTVEPSAEEPVLAVILKRSDTSKKSDKSKSKSKSDPETKADAASTDEEVD